MLFDLIILLGFKFVCFLHFSVNFNMSEYILQSEQYFSCK